MAGRFGGQAITWVITILVIRILSPQDYGLMAMAMYVIGFLALFEELGLASAIVQRKSLQHGLTNQVFGLLIIFNTVLYAALWFGAPIIAEFFGEPELVSIIRVAGLKLPLQVLGVVPDAILRRDMRFKGKSVVQFLAMISGSVTTLALALNGQGVWSLVYGNLATALVRAIGLQYLARFPCVPSFRFRGIGDAIGFGGLVTIDRFLFYLYSQADVFIIGKVLGKEVLGFYSVAMHLAALPMKKIAGLLNEVGFSAFSRIQNEPDKLARHFRKAIRLLSLITFPVFVGISSVTPEIVGIFLGEKWLQAILPMQLLSLVIPFRLLHTVTPTSLYGLGRADVSLGNSAIATLAMPAAFLVGIQWGLTGVCIAWLVTYPLYFSIALTRGLPHVGVSMGQYLKCLLAPLMSAVLMYLAVFGVRHLIVSLQLPASVLLPVLIGTGAIAYTGAIVVLAPGTCREVLETVLPGRLSAWLTRFLPAPAAANSE